ncbi:hypothetical protein [Tumebacillus permanentifrigoris]|uniref:Uncharacterized protein n=1 Tax=Tumebacillus permanentifrigoris TaxID=378543 RepID=A0A316D9U7_9BACL|nr:hypothetical protein [Tumebacillus permanentifrigoris]PWK13403.1 hypothetical protein C7459_10770 [Tumebacillus permanentifrigoris]
MTAVLEYKWMILAVLEVVAWGMTFLMFYARYGMRSQLWFRVYAALFALTGLIPQVLIGILNFAVNRELDVFTLAIVLLLLYGATLGKSQVKKLDAWAERKFAKKETQAKA